MQNMSGRFLVHTPACPVVLSGCRCFTAKRQLHVMLLFQCRDLPCGAFQVIGTTPSRLRLSRVCANTPSTPRIRLRRPNHPVFSTRFLGQKHRDIRRRHAISPGCGQACAIARAWVKWHTNLASESPAYTCSPPPHSLGWKYRSATSTRLPSIRRR